MVPPWGRPTFVTSRCASACPPISLPAPASWCATPTTNEIFHQSRVYLSLTRGDAWVGRELTDGDVNRVAFSPADPLRCYAVTSTGNVYKSSGGWTWRLAHTVATRPSPGYITGLALSWTNPDVLYISFGGYGGPRVMRSDDAGAHWMDRSGTAGDDMPAIPITSIVVSP